MSNSAILKLDFRLLEMGKEYKINMIRAVMKDLSDVRGGYDEIWTYWHKSIRCREVD